MSLAPKAQAALNKFTLALDEFVKVQVPKKALAVQQKIALDALRLVVKKSPVDTGRFRGEWQLSLTRTTKLTNRLDKRRRGTNPNGDVVAQEAANIASADPYGVIWLTNALPYAEALENGHSKQAPQGVLALSLTELRARIARELSA